MLSPPATPLSPPHLAGCAQTDPLPHPPSDSGARTLAQSTDRAVTQSEMTTEPEMTIGAGTDLGLMPTSLAGMVQKGTAAVMQLQCMVTCKAAAVEQRMAAVVTGTETAEMFLEVHMGTGRGPGALTGMHVMTEIITGHIMRGVEGRTGPTGTQTSVVQAQLSGVLSCHCCSY